MAGLLDRFMPLMELRNSLFNDGGPDPFSVKMTEILSQTEAMIGMASRALRSFFSA